MRVIDPNLVNLAADHELSEEDAAKVRWLISHIPGIDVPDIVRCESCAYFRSSPFGSASMGWCRIHGKHHAPKYFCADADPKK